MTTESELPDFARRLKELRERAGLTQQQLAMNAGLSISNISQPGTGC